MAGERAAAAAAAVSGNSGRDGTAGGRDDGGRDAVWMRSVSVIRMDEVLH